MTEDQKAKGLHYHMYDSLEGIKEHSERIVELEEIASTLYVGADRLCKQVVLTCDRCPYVSVGVPCGLTKAYDKLREMGVDVWE